MNRLIFIKNRYDSRVKVPSHLFVHLDGSPQAVKVSTAGCTDVADFIKATKTELSEELGSISRNRITLHLDKNSDFLMAAQKLPQLCTDNVGAGRDHKTALIVKIHSTSNVPQAPIVVAERSKMMNNFLLAFTSNYHKREMWTTWQTSSTHVWGTGTIPSFWRRTRRSCDQAVTENQGW